MSLYLFLFLFRSVYVFWLSVILFLFSVWYSELYQKHRSSLCKESQHCANNIYTVKTCVFKCVSIYNSVCLFIFLIVRLFVLFCFYFLSVCLPFSLCIPVSLSLSVSYSLFLSSVCLSACLNSVISAVAIRAALM